MYTRILEQELINWKNKSNRKPLILRGARQVGKTTLVKFFGKQYKHQIYLNIERQKDRVFFETTDDINKIVESIFLTKKIPLSEAHATLLFIDEIQEQPEIIHLLRYFYEDYPQLHVISAGSLLEFALHKVRSFPVGRVEFLYLNPFNFNEFLMAKQHTLAVEQLNIIPVKEIAHKTLMDFFHTYAIIGGMPEAITHYLETDSFTGLSKIYEGIWKAYVGDSEKYASNSTEQKVIKHIMNTAPLHLDQRIKFQNFGNSNYKSKEVSEAMRDLAQARIIQLIYPTTSLEIPITPDYKKSPRLQILDTGIVNNATGIVPDLLLNDDLSDSYKGALIPHIITQEILSLQTHSSRLPCFWVREKNQSSAEVDLVYPHKNMVIPIEIKSGSTGSLKSLHQFINRVNHPYAIRIYAGKFEVIKTETPEGKPYILMNMPYYLGTMIPKYIEYFVTNYSLEN